MSSGPAEGNAVTFVLKGPVDAITEKLKSRGDIKKIESKGRGFRENRFRVITDGSVDIRGPFS